MEEKLNNYSKVLLATSAINQMYFTVYTVNNDLKVVDHYHTNEYSEGVKKAIHEGSKMRDQFLNKKLKQLISIVEDLGNFMNNSDMTQAIDVRINTPIMDILIHGKDEIENDYE